MHAAAGTGRRFCAPARIFFLRHPARRQPAPFTGRLLDARAPRPIYHPQPFTYPASRDRL
jgi:hypothetical protein